MAIADMMREIMNRPVPDTIAVSLETKQIIEASTGVIRNKQRRKRILREFENRQAQRIREARRNQAGRTGLDQFIHVGGE